MRTILRILTVVAVIACSSESASAPVPLAELETAAGSVSLNGQEVILTPYLWRDFMPSTPMDGRPMIANLRVQSADGSALAGPLSIDAAWVVKGDEVWTGPIGEGGFAVPTPVFYEVVMRNGPKWGPGISVDVVVRVRDTKGEAQLLRASNVPIHRTE